MDMLLKEMELTSYVSVRGSKLVMVHQVSAEDCTTLSRTSYPHFVPLAIPFLDNEHLVRTSGSRRYFWSSDVWWDAIEYGDGSTLTVDVTFIVEVAKIQMV